MPDRIPIELDPLPATLLFSLWCRAWANTSPVPLLHDPESVRILRAIEHDFRPIDRLMPEDRKIAAALRARMLDEKIRAFLRTHPQATVVNIGAGLDTAFQRVDNGQAHWIDLDTPDVIALRSRLIPGNERCRALPSSLLDEDWLDRVESRGHGLIFLCCSVLPYIPEDQVRRLFERLSARFTGAEFLFDAYTSVQLALHNAVVWFGGPPPMRWALGNARRMLPWSAQIELAGQEPLFRNVTLGSAWTLRSRLLARFYARFGFWNIVHLRFV